MSRKDHYDHLQYLKKNYNTFSPMASDHCPIPKSPSRKIDLSRSSVTARKVEAIPRNNDQAIRLSLSNRAKRPSFQNINNQQTHVSKYPKIYRQSLSRNTSTMLKNISSRRDSYQENQQEMHDKNLSTKQHYQNITYYTQRQNANLKQQNDYLLEQLKRAKQRQSKVQRVYQQYKQYKKLYEQTIEEIETTRLISEEYRKRQKQYTKIKDTDIVNFKQKLAIQLNQIHEPGQKINRYREIMQRMLNQSDCPEQLYHKSSYKVVTGSSTKQETPTDQSDRTNLHTNYVDHDDDKFIKQEQQEKRNMEEISFTDN